MFVNSFIHLFFHYSSSQSVRQAVSQAVEQSGICKVVKCQILSFTHLTPLSQSFIQKTFLEALNGLDKLLFSETS
jgi:uncharacterized membrane protein